MSLQKQAISMAIRNLSVMGCKFKVIEPDGTEHGELLVAEPAKSRKRGGNKYPHGALKAYFEPLVKDMLPGEAKKIPAGQFKDPADLQALRGSLASWASATWGLKTYMTAIEGDHIEVLRLG